MWRDFRASLLWGHEQLGPNWIIGAWVWRTFVTLKTTRAACRAGSARPVQNGRCVPGSADNLAEAVLERAAREDRSTPAPLWAKSAASTAPWIPLPPATSPPGPLRDIHPPPL